MYKKDSPTKLVDPVMASVGINTQDINQGKLVEPQMTFQPPMPANQMGCLLYTSPSPRDRQKSRMPSSA